VIGNFWQDLVRTVLYVLLPLSLLWALPAAAVLAQVGCIRSRGTAHADGVRLLLCMARHHGKVLTHSHLLREVWGPQHEGDVAFLRVYMGQLRQKIETEPARPRWLLTEPGVGYRLAAADQV